MREDALYYTQRELEERALAQTSADPRVQQVHALLANKYHQLAERELMKLQRSGRTIN